MTPISDRINLEDVMMTAVQNSSKCNANTFAIAATNKEDDKPSQKTNLFDLNNINRAKLRAIACKLKEAGILDADETLEQWLSAIMPQVTSGEDITVAELLAGLKQFLELE